MSDLRCTYREKLDGSWDSICLICLATVSKASTEAGLQSMAWAHRCDLTALGQRFADQAHPPQRVLPPNGSHRRVG